MPDGDILPGKHAGFPLMDSSTDHLWAWADVWHTQPVEYMTIAQFINFAEERIGKPISSVHTDFQTILPRDILDKYGLPIYKET